ncbi:hypothetical protein KIN20_003054 [Parelaphostrongylus tenuis]|uniref:Uncharacterized protein n=1 Tax=Parelaphostrongylus tenuis TaxID=148309 RepID=A0AAD5MF39_PARTN|nr:hypothetical protein KIN20_003054 [Parelaphostrongylus tenuis]
MFHDGKPDCPDGSDEWCFFGQIKCGAYCVDMSHAVNCLFSSKCDNTNGQPPWCAISNQLYVKTLETSFRCYYNRTKQVVMPPPLNYTDRFLKPLHRVVLPSIRPPQHPTLFPAPLTPFTLPNMFLTPPPSFQVPPPVHLSKVTGLPALPPPFPTLVVKQSVPVPYSPTKETISVPDLLTAPDYPFDAPILQQTTSSYSQNPPDFPENIIHIKHGAQPLYSTMSSDNHLSAPSSSPVENPEGILTKHGYGHIRGRMKSTTASPSIGKLTHIRVVAGGNEAGNPQGEKTRH